MTYENLLYEQKGAVGFITFNRPKVLNALNSATMRELDDALSNAGRDSAVRALILTGAGEKAFVAGADINELARCTATDGRAGYTSIACGRKSRFRLKSRNEAQYVKAA